MADLPIRADRAGVTVTLLDQPERAGPFDVVLADVPCSGSGSWRRDPEGKWALTPERLAALLSVQAGIMDRAVGLLRPGGVLAYATCSMIGAENADQIAAFLLRHPGWTVEAERRFTPLQGGDGFFAAILRKPG